MDLPQEILAHLFSFSYTWQEVLSFRGVCSQWHALLSSLGDLKIGTCPLPFAVLFPRVKIQTLITTPKSGALLTSWDPRLRDMRSLDILVHPKNLGLGTLYVHQLLGWVIADPARTLFLQLGPLDNCILRLGYEHGTLVIDCPCTRFLEPSTGFCRLSEHIMDDVLEIAGTSLPIHRIYFYEQHVSETPDHLRFLRKIVVSYPNIQFYFQESLIHLIHTELRYPIPKNLVNFITVTWKEARSLTKPRD